MIHQKKHFHEFKQFEKIHTQNTFTYFLRKHWLLKISLSAHAKLDRKLFLYLKQNNTTRNFRVFSHPI